MGSGLTRGPWAFVAEAWGPATWLSGPLLSQGHLEASGGQPRAPCMWRGEEASLSRGAGEWRRRRGLGCLAPASSSV